MPLRSMKTCIIKCEAMLVIKHREESRIEFIQHGLLREKGAVSWWLEETPERAFKSALRIVSQAQGQACIRLGSVMMTRSSVAQRSP